MALTTDPAPTIPPETLKTNCELLLDEINKYSDWDAEVMLAIGKAESKHHSCSPTGHNLTMSENHGVCIGSYGALQVGCVHYSEGDDINDMKTNVKIAYDVWKGQGYNAWTTYTNGAYRDFIQ